MSLYQAKKGNDKYTYNVTDDFLLEEWSRPGDSSSKSFPLESLSHEFSSWTGVSPSVQVKLKKGGYFFMAAIVVFFSEINHFVPLLAPVLLILGVGHWYNDLAWAFPATWTVIKDKNDNDITFLLHDESNEKDRLEFEEKLKFCINKTRDITKVCN